MSAAISKPDELDYVVACGKKSQRFADLGEALVEAYEASELNGSPATVHTNGELLATVTTP